MQIVSLEVNLYEIANEKCYSPHTPVFVEGGVYCFHIVWPSYVHADECLVVVVF